MKISVVTCGRCGKPRGLFHTCVTRIGRRPGRTRIRVRAECPMCGKPIGNPLQHTCTTRTDFKRRQAAASSHRPSRCPDTDCPRPPCRAYREGYENGHEDGYGEGWGAGYAAGRAAR
jgi:hypothetical protein